MEAIKRSPSIVVVYGALVLIQVLFGMNYVISKLVVEQFPPLVWASFRIIVSSLLMLAVCLVFRRKKRPRDGWRFFGPMVVFALLGSVINQASFLVGLKHTTSTNSAVLNTLIPVFTLLIVTLRGQEKLTWPRGLGFAMALGGALIIRRLDEFSLSNQTLFGDALTVLNCLSYGIFLSYSKKFIERYDRVWTTTWLFLYGSVGLTALAMPDWAGFHWPEMNGSLLACMAFAIFGGTLLTYFLNVWTLAHVKSSSVAAFIYIQPVITVALAWGWMGQKPTERTLVSSGMIFCGMILALYAGRKPAVAPVQSEWTPEPMIHRKTGTG